MMFVNALKKKREATDDHFDDDDLSSVDVHDNDNNNNNDKQSAFSKAWTSTLTRIRKPITSVLLSMAGVSARNPKSVILSYVIFSLSILGIGLFTNFHVEVDADLLWTPTPSRVLSHGTWFEKESAFPTVPRNVQIAIHADGENIITEAQEATKRLFILIDTIRNTMGYDVLCDEAKIVMKDYRNDGGAGTTCFIESCVRFWDYNFDTFMNNVTSDDDTIKVLSQTTFPDDVPVDGAPLFGNSQRDEDGLLTSAQMFTNTIFVPEIDTTLDIEKRIIQNVLKLRKQWEEESDNMFRLELFTDRSFDDEMERGILNDIPLFPLAFLVMSIFTCLIFFRKDWVHSRTIVGFGAVCSVFMSIMIGYGFLFIIGVPFTSVTQVLPFIMFGIGLDDAFILWGAYQRTDPLLETEERIQDTIRDVGVSIFVTTLTSVTAFSLGCISSIPAVYWLCYYAAPTIAIDFILQITLFVAIIQIDGQRVKDRRKDCLFCLSAISDEGDGESQDDNKNVNTRNIFDRFMIWFSHVLLQPMVKVAVILSFLGMLGGFTYSAFKLEQRFEIAEVLPSGSYVAKFWSTIDGYNHGSGIAPYIIFRDVDQSAPDIQEQMEQYVNDLVEIDAIADQPTFFWLRDFKSYISSSGVAGLYNASFTDQLDSFLAVPSFYKLYKDDIVRDDIGNIIISRTRCRMDNVALQDVTMQVQALTDAMSVSDSQPINEDRKDWAFFTYDITAYNVWMFYTSTPSELLLSTVLSITAVTVITLIFIPHWTSALFVGPIMIMLYADLLGFLQVCGIAINSITFISLVLSIGLMVDFLVHVLLRYYESEALTRAEKVKDALQTMGVSVLIGGLSTFLGVIPLAFASSDIFYTLFITFLGLVVLGLAHGLIFLPVVLSLLGPNVELNLSL